MVCGLGHVGAYAAPSELACLHGWVSVIIPSVREINDMGAHVCRCIYTYICTYGGG